MNFTLDEEERALQAGIRDLCRGRAPMDRVRAAEQTAGVDRALWRELAEAGVFSLRLPESAGGVGLGMTHAVVVFEELGRALVPGPLVATHLAAGLVPGAAEGEAVVGFVEAGPGPVLVEHPDVLDALLVLDGGAVRRADPLGDATSIADPLDPLTPLARAAAPPAGEPLDADGERLRLEGAVLTAALALGIAAETTERAVAYAKERRQFGRPIGSFQAVKHICADMLVRAEVARAAVYAAGALLDGPAGGDPARAAHGAKLLACEAAVINGKACIQVHGGMGYTWEVDAHLYLKRAVVLSTHFGRADEHSEALAAAL